ncbi:MAG TPA: DNA-processing protein DprA [Polyangia bacterium]|jgi:DNA processing protein|nr:DNA-processing protein DprA [Polyangia bacterium]
MFGFEGRKRTVFATKRTDLSSLAETFFCSAGDPRYPRSLADLARPPGQLWVTGRLPTAAERSVAIVGSRGATAVGYTQAQEIAAAVGGAGWSVVSGGALGIDAAAHLGALQAGAPTFAVLGCGVDVVYPDRHTELFSRVAQAGGLLSEYPMGTPPRSGQFPARNRLVAALAEAVVVVDARTRSGALITAQRARELRRLLLAVPGSRGTDWLIGSGAAQPVAGASEVLDRLAGRAAVAAPVPYGLQPLLDALREGPDSAAGLAQHIGQPLSEVMSALSEAELAGLIQRLAGGRYEVPRAK